MEEQDPARPNFREPEIDVVTHGLLRMESIEVENVDALRLELGERVIEAGTQKRGERFVVCSIVRGDLGKSGLVITAGLLVAAPGIDAETSRAGVVLGRGLAKGEIAFAPIDTELDEKRRSQCGHEVIGEMKMVRPGADSVDARLELARGQI